MLPGKIPPLWWYVKTRCQVSSDGTAVCPGPGRAPSSARPQTALTAVLGGVRRKASHSPCESLPIVSKPGARWCPGGCHPLFASCQGPLTLLTGALRYLTHPPGAQGWMVAKGPERLQQPSLNLRTSWQNYFLFCLFLPETINTNKLVPQNTQEHAERGHQRRGLSVGGVLGALCCARGHPLDVGSWTDLG